MTTWKGGCGMAKLKLYTAIALIVIVLIVLLQNREPVETKFLFASITMPRAALLGVTLLFGMAAGVLLTLGLSRKSPRR